tara:strand:- start:659 stop:1594 length:936 start_codon:yes stop_codon:yes gene_type:complete
MKKKIGVALGGGAFKGFAHIGILKVLEKNGIRPDYVAGTSAGAIIGALYCSGKSVKEIEKIIHKTNFGELLDFVLPNEGFLAGDRIEKYVGDLIDNVKFEDLEIPLQIVAADLKTGDKIIFNKGDVADAVRASISIPIIFEPKHDGRRLLVDGGVVDPLPVSVVRNMGASYVIAVDVSSPVSTNFAKGKPSKFGRVFKKKFVEQESENVLEYLNIDEKAPIVQLLFDPEKFITLFKGKKKAKLPKFLKYNLASVHLMTNELSKHMTKYADVVIHPNFKGVLPLDTTNTKAIIKRGELAAEKKVRQILKDIK